MSRLFHLHDAALCQRALVTGTDPVTGAALTAASVPSRSRSDAVRAGIAEVQLNGNLRGKPTLIVAGHSDSLVPINHSSRVRAVQRTAGDVAPEQRAVLESHDPLVAVHAGIAHHRQAEVADMGELVEGRVQRRQGLAHQFTDVIAEHASEGFVADFDHAIPGHAHAHRRKVECQLQRFEGVGGFHPVRLCRGVVQVRLAFT